MRRLAVVTPLLLATACRATLDLPDGMPGGGDGPRAAVAVEPRGYAGDARFEALAAGWSRRAGAALERLAVVTGLGFRAGREPRVVLRPFGDERRDHELGAEVVDGNRRVVVRVNAEPLLARVRDADTVLLRALAAAAFEDAAGRHGTVPAWVVETAAAAASGDVEARLEALVAQGVLEDAEPRVDPADPTAASTTGLAVLALLAQRERPGEVRRLLSFVADGDDAEGALGRLLHAPDRGWVEAARIALGERLAQVDPGPWRLLRRLEREAALAGRAGLEAALPPDVPAAVAPDVALLRARAALAEGDVPGARAALGAWSPDAPSAVRDPAGALALRARLASAPGGDAAFARELARRLERDFPASEAAASLAEADPLGGLEEDPVRWAEGMRARLAADEASALPLEALVQYGRILLLDHRAGAAARFLDDLGPRGQAPELERLRDTVAQAQEAPSPAARDRAAARVAAWTRATGATPTRATGATPTRATGATEARDVRDSGGAAREALLAVVRAAGVGQPHRAAVALLVETLGAREAAVAVAATWAAQPGRVGPDLEALVRAVPYDVLADVLEAERADGSVAPQWSRLTFELPDTWLRQDVRFLADLHAPDYATRHAAFDRILRQAPRGVTPALVAHGMADPAALLRREAVRAAGTSGFRALARRGLQDAAPLVREEAAYAVGRIEGRAAVPTLAGLLRDDPVLQVRAAAASALLQGAPGDARALDALLDTQVRGEPRLRDAIGARLAAQQPAPVVAAIVRGWTRALGRRDPHRGYLSRTALLYARLTGEDLGYHPGTSAEALRAMAERMRAWLAAPARGGTPAPARRAVGRLR